ncbi:MAG: hypothetical protein ACYC1C_21390 [Chloroflexota bacterium]
MIDQVVTSTLQVAIRERLRVSISYQGAERVLDPYLVGITPKGNKALRAHQVRGHSASGRLPAWRLYLIDSIDRIELLEDHFEVNAAYNPDDKGMVKVLFRIDWEAGSR